MAIKHSTVLAESPKPRGAQVWRGYQRGMEQKLKTDPAVEDQEQYVLRWGSGEGWVVSHDNNPYRACTRIAALWAVRGRSWLLIYTWKCADGYYQCVSKCQELPGTTRKLLAWVQGEILRIDHINAEKLVPARRTIKASAAAVVQSKSRPEADWTWRQLWLQSLFLSFCIENKGLQHKYLRPAHSLALAQQIMQQ